MTGLSGAPLLACVGLDRHIVAQCAAPNCEQRTPCDPTIWVTQGLGGLPLGAFSSRLRCVCGSRKGRLVVEEGPFPGMQEGGGLYVFR